jgi:hypothetical protein
MFQVDLCLVLCDIIRVDCKLKELNESTTWRFPNMLEEIWSYLPMSGSQADQTKWWHRGELTDLETKPTEPGLCSLQCIMLSNVPAVSPILKAPAWMPPTVEGPRIICTNPIPISKPDSTSPKKISPVASLHKNAYKLVTTWFPRILISSCCT